MVSRRRGRPRKKGARYRSGKLKAANDRVDSPAKVARSQPHRRGLGDKASDQRAENALGRMYLREELTELQLLAAERYATLWRGYLATLGGPRTGSAGRGRVFPCSGCAEPWEKKYCACDRASRSWRQCWDRLALEGCAVLATQVCCYDMVCPPEHFLLLCTGLDALAYQLGLTNQRKRDYRYASSKSPPDPA